MERPLAEVNLTHDWICHDHMKTDNPIFRSEILDWITEQGMKVTISYQSLREGPVGDVSIYDYSGKIWERASNERLIFESPEDAVLFKLTWR